MKSAQLLLVTALVAAMAASTSAGILDDFVPTIVTDFYKAFSSQESYRFTIDDPNGSKREEMGVILNPGTDKEELVVMGTYSSIDEKTNTQTTTVYTADKNGYRPRYEIKNRQLAGPTLKSLGR